MSFTVESRGNDSSNPFLEHRKPDMRVRLLRLYVLFATLILIGALVTAYLLKTRIEQNIVAGDLALVKTLAVHLTPGSSETQFTDEFGILIEISSIDEPLAAIMIEQSNEVLVTYQQGVIFDDSTDWNVWQRLIIRTALFNESGSFTTTDPDGQKWLHSHALLPSSGSKLIIQRPTTSAFASSRLFIMGIIIAVVVYLAGGIFSWLILTNQVIRPLEQLESYSERIRWQGQLSSTEQMQIDKLTQHEDQLGNLARSLTAMQGDTEERLVQLATLLETSRIVAASLESSEVIDNILNQVQTLFRVTRCAVVVMDERAGVFRIRASRGLSETYAKQLRIAPSEPYSPSMRALRNMTPIQVSDTNTDLAFVYLRDRARAEGFRSVLAIPIETQHAPPAALLLFKSDPYRNSYSELELASNFGHHASIALENAALFAKTDEQLQEQTRRLEAIVESLSDGLILESPTGKVLFCNQRVLSMLHVSRGQANNKSSSELIELLLAEAVDSNLARQELINLPHKSGDLTMDLSLRAKNDNVQDLRIHFFDVNEEHGELLGRGQLWQDITRDKELDRMKSALLSTVSHELRTPLATIKGFTSTLLAEDVQWDVAAQQEFLNAISKETDRLTRLVQNLLDMSRIQAGVLTIQCELFSLNDLLPQIVQGFGDVLEKRTLTTMAPDLPPVWMDVSRIGTVMRNLIENAVKYSNPDAPIELSTQIQNGSVLFAVRDYGPGIPAELRHKVFERFFRAENGLTRQVGGTGLGLAISKGFIQAHRGSIWVTSADPGAAFVFSLPTNRECNEG